jgi:hypothetical protein
MQCCRWLHSGPNFPTTNCTISSLCTPDGIAIIVAAPSAPAPSPTGEAGVPAGSECAAPRWRHSFDLDGGRGSESADSVTWNLVIAGRCGDTCGFSHEAMFEGPSREELAVARCEPIGDGLEGGFVCGGWKEVETIQYRSVIVVHVVLMLYGCLPSHCHCSWFHISTIRLRRGHVSSMVLIR